MASYNRKICATGSRLGREYYAGTSDKERVSNNGTLTSREEN
jgi:hypothetical protein